MIFSKFSNLENEILENSSHYDPENTTAIGDFYYNKENYQRAKLWYQIGANQNHGRSCYRLGCIYRYHTILKGRHHSRVFELFSKAFEKGCIEAAYEIGLMFELRIADDNSGDFNGKAMGWYLKAAEQAHPDSLYRIGIFYEKGQPVACNFQMALRYYHRSALQGHEKSKSSIERLRRNGLTISDEQIGILQAEDAKRYKDMIQKRLEAMDETMSTNQDARYMNQIHR